VRAPRWIWALILGLIALGLIVWVLRGACAPERESPSAPADTVAQVDSRPGDKPPTIIERIVEVPVPVERIVTRTVPDSAIVRRYSDLAREYARWRITRQQDSLAGLALDSTPAPPSILPPIAGRYDGRRLTLWLTESSGRRMQAPARVRPHFTFRAGLGGASDSVPQIKADRWLVRELREVRQCAPLTALGMIAGGIIGGRSSAGTLAGAALGGLGAGGICQAHP
jgi:hypothetical protein